MQGAFALAVPGGNGERPRDAAVFIQRDERQQSFFVAGADGAPGVAVDLQLTEIHAVVIGTGKADARLSGLSLESIVLSLVFAVVFDFAMDGSHHVGDVFEVHEIGVVVVAEAFGALGPVAERVNLLGELAGAGVRHLAEHQVLPFHLPDRLVVRIKLEVHDDGGLRGIARGELVVGHDTFLVESGLEGARFVLVVGVGALVTQAVLVGENGVAVGNPSPVALRDDRLVADGLSLGVVGCVIFVGTVLAGHRFLVHDLAAVFVVRVEGDVGDHAVESGGALHHLAFVVVLVGVGVGAVGAVRGRQDQAAVAVKVVPGRRLDLAVRLAVGGIGRMTGFVVLVVVDRLRVVLGAPYLLGITALGVLLGQRFDDTVVAILFPVVLFLADELAGLVVVVDRDARFAFTIKFRDGDGFDRPLDVRRGDVSVASFGLSGAAGKADHQEDDQQRRYIIQFFFS